MGDMEQGWMGREVLWLHFEFEIEEDTAVVEAHGRQK